MQREVYYENDDFKVYLEKIEEQIFIHVAVYNFSKPIFKHIRQVWAEVAIRMFFDGYEDLFAYTKDNRIVKMIGGATKIGQHEDYEVWKWDLS